MIGEALTASTDALRAAGVEDPRFDAELLLTVATGWDRARIAADAKAEIAPAASRRFAEMVRRRTRREPVAYIVGSKGFRQIELAVDPRVLIPRPETELLVELALELEPHRVLDLGTGSGAIALAVAVELPDCEVTAADISAAALEVARSNVDRLGLQSRVSLVESEARPTLGTFDVVLANLPYVSEAEWDGLAPEVTEWEPSQALLAGSDGLDALRDAIPAAASLAPVMALEVGAGQASKVGELVMEVGFDSVETRTDLAGIPRLVIGHREAVA